MRAHAATFQPLQVQGLEPNAMAVHLDLPMARLFDPTGLTRAVRGSGQRTRPACSGLFSVQS